ncbi:MAG: hypothetical protein WCR93_00300 [Bacilli bacterium]
MDIHYNSFTINAIVKVDIDNNIYHKIINFIDNKTNIEIYLKNVF